LAISKSRAKAEPKATAKPNPFNAEDTEERLRALREAKGTITQNFFEARSLLVTGVKS
jgi:hypothetical protein